MTNIFDAHCHIIDPNFPLVENNGYLPPRFSVQDYLNRVNALGVCSGVVVSGSFQAFDQSYLLSALSQLNHFHDGFVGVTQIPFDYPDVEIIKLHQAGVRGVRFNLHRGGSESVEYLGALAQRVFELAKWHVELYISHSMLEDLSHLIPTLPAVCIDHLGLQRQSFDLIDRLVDKGARVKACGFGRVDFDAVTRIKALHKINPSALMFGTDLPCTRAPRAFEDSDLHILREELSQDVFQRIAWQNGREFYQLERN